MVGAAIGILSVLDIVLDMDDKNTQRNQQIRAHNQEIELREKQAKVDRNIQYVNAAVDILSKGFDIYSKHKAQQHSAQVADNSSFKTLPVPPVPPQNYLTQPAMEIDYNSVYFDKTNKVMSARVVDKSSGQIHLYAYHIQDISSSQRNILESVDGSQWNQVGVLNSKTAPEDIGTPRAGGYIFGEIFKTILGNERQKQVTQQINQTYRTQQIEKSTMPPQVNKNSKVTNGAQVLQPGQNSRMLSAENDFDENSDETVSVEDYEEAIASFTARAGEVYGNMPHVYFCDGNERSMNKIVNAIKAYAPLGEYGEYPILSFDDTFFGGADDGFLISDKALYFHNAFEDGNYRFSRDQIHSITNDYNNLCIWINGNMRLGLALVNKDKKSFDAMIDMIKDCLRLQL